MRRLILMRHAKSDWNHPGLADHERPLNKRGRASARALGGWLREHGYLPGEVLCSTAQRTGETLHGLGLPDATDTRFCRPLYHAEARTMRDILSTAAASEVLMIGHNPGICELAHRIADTPPAHPRFSDYPTGATFVVDFDIEDWSGVSWGKGVAVDFVVPRDLTG